MKSLYKDSLVYITYECKYYIVLNLNIEWKKFELSNWKDVEIINLSRLYSYVCKYTTEIESVIIYGIFERKKYINNIWEMFR